MSKIRHNSVFNELSTYIVIAIIIAIAVLGLVALVYGVVGYFEGETLRAVATFLVFCVLGSFVLGLQVGKANVRGIEKGIDMKLSAHDRAKATPTPKTLPATPALAALQRANDDLLPRFEPRARIVERREDSDTPLEI
jgi:hypothetical protein